MFIVGEEEDGQQKVNRFRESDVNEKGVNDSITSDRGE